MKRINNIYEKVISIENLELADKNAQKGKTNYGITKHNKNKKNNIKQLHDELEQEIFEFSKYEIMIIQEYGKEREIKKTPYFPDHILHHAIMQQLTAIFIKTFTKDTYACIKERGIHKCRKNIVKDLNNDKEGTKYCLKTDIRHFYQSIDNQTLKTLFRKKIKDKKMIGLLDKLIDTTKGLPMGNYTSQSFANFYLSEFDHFVKEKLKVKYYYRYCDDMIFLSDDKSFLREILKEITKYLDEKLKLTIKKNYQIFPTDKRGIDFIGFRFYHTHILIRKRIKKKFCQKVAKLNKKKETTIQQYKTEIASWLGWCKYTNSKHLITKIIKEDYANTIKAQIS